MLGHMHFFSENFSFSIPPPPPPPIPLPLPLSKLNQRAESALFRSNIDQGGGGTSLCANATLQSVENRAISEHLSHFQAVPRTFVQDCRSGCMAVNQFQGDASDYSEYEARGDVKGRKSSDVLYRQDELA